MTERRYSITEKQLDALKKLAERLDLSAPAVFPVWKSYVSGRHRDKFDELIERLEDVCSDLENCVTSLDNIIDDRSGGKKTNSDVLRDFRFLIEDIEGQEAAL